MILPFKNTIAVEIWSNYPGLKKEHFGGMAHIYVPIQLSKLKISVRC